MNKLELTMVDVVTTPRQVTDAVIRADIAHFRDHNRHLPEFFIVADPHIFRELQMAYKLIPWKDCYLFGINDPVAFSVDDKFELNGIPIKREEPRRRRR